ncbi:MAG: hypothetical protein GXO89_18170 [Chlorobi bacterium]|nr:hypothetical protein [Chlorobiota bacterium]
MRLLLITTIFLFVQGLNAQPKPYQETLNSVVHTTTFLTGKPFPKRIVKINHDFSFRFYNVRYERYDHSVERKTIKIVDSTLTYIEKADFMELVAAFRKLDFNSLYVPKKKSEDSIVASIMGSASNEYIIKTSTRVFTIGDGKKWDETYSEALWKLIMLIEDIEGKYKPRD